MTAIPYKPSRSTPMEKGGPCEITLDAETIPSQLPQIRDMLLKDITPAKNLKDPEKIEADIAAKQESVMDKAGLNGLTCHIISLAVAIDDHEPVSFSTDSWENERKIIVEFFDYITKNCGNYAHTFIGHCVVGFDLKVLRQRCMVLGIKWPVIFESAFKDKWGESVFDTMLKWNGGDKHDFVSLEKLCMAFGVDTPKTEMTGADVYNYWRQGRIDEIAEYNKGDVIAVRAVKKAMTFDNI